MRHSERDIQVPNLNSLKNDLKLIALLKGKGGRCGSLDSGKNCSDCNSPKK